MSFQRQLDWPSNTGSFAIRGSAVQTAICLLFIVGINQEITAQISPHSETSGQGHQTTSQKHAGSLADNRLAWPAAADVKRVLLMQDYNTRIVLWGTTTLGLAAGITGTFLLLRKRSLLGDVVGHASLPGVAIAFLIMELREPQSGKWLPGLLIGASISGIAGMVSTVIIRSCTRIKEDAALAITLGAFYGLGIVLFTIIQKLPTGSQAGLGNFIYGNTATITQSEVDLIWRVAIVAIVAAGLLFKEFGLLCFDEQFASSQGWPVVLLDLILMGLVVAVCVIGLRSVGLLLVVALLIIPAASARFWTEKLSHMTFCAAVIGVVSCYVGAVSSALFSRLAAGAVIVLTGSVMFCASLCFGTRRGVLLRWYTRRRLNQRIATQQLLLAIFETVETALLPNPQQALTDVTVTLEDLLPKRSWTAKQLRRSLHEAQKAQYLASHPGRGHRLTAQGGRAAHRAARNHRLWELYLLQHADVAPGHVDRDADRIEQILDPEIISGLESALFKKYPQMAAS